MTKKKLLIYSTNLKPEKAQIALINLLKKINYNKYEVDLLLEKNEGKLKKSIPKHIKILDYKISNNKINVLKIIQNFINKIKFKLKNYHKYDCAVSFFIDSKNSYFYIKNASKRRVIFIFDDYTNIYKNEKIRDFFTQKNIYDFNHIVFFSNQSKDNFLKYYPSLSKKTHVINSIINYDVIEKKSREKILENIKRNNTNLLLIGELNEEKNNILAYLKLINELKTDISNIKLYIIGEGIDEFAYKSYVEDNKLQENVFFLGTKKNIYPYIKKCNYLTLIGKFEDNPLLAMETLLLKTQIFSTMNFSDDVIDNDYIFAISKQFNKMKEEIKNILLNKEKKRIKFNIENINNEKLEKIERLFDK